MVEVVRCGWATSDPALVTYHDREWGVPLHDDRRHFEFLILDAMQAGLSWLTILRKRDAFRKAFDGFDPRRVARYDAARVELLMGNPGIVRNRAKIQASVRNARAFLRVKEEFGSFDDYIWQFVDGEPRLNKYRRMAQIPARTKQSDAMSKDLIARNFSFVGSTICYAYMQAAGLVNDHLVSCHRYDRV
ncbi:MAG: DNA-3-methyladenine glycosylase I [Deltaproteobacteria bacterium]|jgi:DNA-3-methyladenine glycosylase I|nr:DNA-3-methyladenine glycosylase I [Deltaproteobacteria bacterium]